MSRDDKQPASKRRKVQEGQPKEKLALRPSIVPTAQHLVMVPAGLAGALSPAAVHSCRIVAMPPELVAQPPGVSFASLFATGRSVFWSSVYLSPDATTAEQGKEGIMLPARAQAAPATALQQLQHRAEVQSLALGDASERGSVLLGTADCYGRGVLTRVSMQPGQTASVGEVQQVAPDGPLREAGWAGVAFNTQRAGESAVARMFARDVQLFSRGCHARTFGMQLPPQALLFAPMSVGTVMGLMAVAEGHTVSLWDARAGEAGGLVQRMALGAPGTALHCLAWCPTQQGLLGAAGSERSLYMVDPRKWRTHIKWAGAARQAIHQLHFLDMDPRLACLAGLDLEVLCARWDAPPSAVRAFQSNSGNPAGGGVAAEEDRDGGPAGITAPATGVAFRGDGRWLGLSKAPGADVLAGLAASGNLMYASLAPRAGHTDEP